MIEQPESKVEAYVEAGADVITFHVEATRHPHRVAPESSPAAASSRRRAQPGHAAGRGRAAARRARLRARCSRSTPAGRGSAYGRRTAARIAALRDLVGDREMLVGVDGGVTKENVAAVAAMVPNVIVTGSAVFDGKAPLDNARFMIEETRARV